MQINRLFEIIYLLLGQSTITAGQLAAHFEVSPRTIYRDVELLSSTGIPIYMTKGKGGGISLLPDFVLNKTVLTDHEKADILSALHAVDAVSPDKTNTAINKLSSLFGSGSGDWIEVDFSDWANADEEAHVFNMLKAAILGRQMVTFLYHGEKNSALRTVEPLKLCFKGQSWYLYAFCKLRNDYRFFKLRRIKQLSSLSEHFERATPAKLFDDRYIFPDEYVEITLKLSPSMAYRVYDEFTQYEQQPDGSFIALLTMPKGDWVYHYVATFGAHCEVLAPEEIRLQIKAQLQKTLQQYL